VTLPRKPARYWGDGDFNALADAIEGVSDSMPITYNQDDPPVPPIPANSVWIDTNDGGRAYVWSGTDWVSLEGPPGPQGPDGLDGIDGDDGLPGPAGTSSYTHIAYANEDVTPWSGFSTSDATNKLYIGMLVNDVQADPGIEDAGLYRWTLIKGLDGEDGIPGAPGADGQTPYFHVAYANEGVSPWAGFSTTDAAGKTWIGTYTDYTEADPGIGSAGLYAWALFKGADGAPGGQGDPGARGAGNFHYQSALGPRTPAQFAVLADSVTPGENVFQDRVTVFNPDYEPPWTETRFWDGDSWEPMAQYIDGGLLVNGTIAGDALVGNTITGDKVRANTLTVDRLVLPWSDNLVPNGNSDGTPPEGGWPAGAWEAVGLYGSSAYQGTYCRKIEAADTSLVTLQVSPWITVAEGENIYAESMATPSRSSSGSTPCGRMVLAFRNAAGEEFAWLFKDPATGAYNKLIINGAAPAGATSMCLRYEVSGGAGYAYADNIVFRKSAPGFKRFAVTFTGNQYSKWIANPEPDINYALVFTVTEYSGVIADGCFIIAGSSKQTNGFQFNIRAEPTNGSVTWDIILLRI
jgi:hypothetical protein